MQEELDMFRIIRELKKKFGFTGFSLSIRSGDPDHHAGSIAHIHVNMHHADGSDKLEVTLGKSEADLNRKLPVLLVWEKARLNIEANREISDDLTAEEIEMVVKSKRSES